MNIDQNQQYELKDFIPIYGAFRYFRDNKNHEENSFKGDSLLVYNGAFSLATLLGIYYSINSLEKIIERVIN